MPGRLYQAIEALKAGLPFDPNLLIRKVDAVVLSVHRKRLGFAWVALRAEPEKKDDRLVSKMTDREGRFRWYTPKERDQLHPGAVIVEFEGFRESCWKKLKQQKFMGKILKLTPGDDPQVEKYLWRSFQRVLEQKTYELTSGLETRVRQINRVLKDQCSEESRTMGIWKLNTVVDEPEISAALLEDLHFVGRGITPPSLKYPSNPESKRGPSIPDAEMKKYLISLIEAVGGATRRTTLIDYIKGVYGLDPIRTVPPPTDPDDEDESDLIDTIESPNDIYMSQEHFLMAESILRGMTPRQKLIYYHRAVVLRTLARTAEIIDGIKTTTIHNEMKAIIKDAKKVFSRYDCDDPLEGKAVMDLVDAMIKKEMEACGPYR